MKFIVECTWSGYKPGNEKVCHRSLIPVAQAVALQRLHAVRFTDGTYMTVTVRRRLKNEPVVEIRRYDKVLEEAWRKNAAGSVSVMDL